MDIEIKSLWKLDPQTDADVERECRLRGDLETVRRHACTVVQRALVWADDNMPGIGAVS